MEFGLIGSDFSDESKEAFNLLVNKRIESINLTSYDELVIAAHDGTIVVLKDAADYCCEYRYVSTDDPLQYFIGATVYRAEVRDSSYSEIDSGYEHEIQFLVIDTSKGSFTLETHNQHNGYYGGFNLVCYIDNTPIEEISVDRPRRGEQVLYLGTDWWYTRTKNNEYGYLRNTPKASKSSETILVKLSDIMRYGPDQGDEEDV